MAGLLYLLLLIDSSARLLGRGPTIVGLVLAFAVLALGLCAVLGVHPVLTVEVPLRVARWFVRGLH
jgi:hypothetical protein